MRCADRGKKVCLIEGRARNGSGGTCVNRGCIPTKALMASANLYASIKEAKAFGINVDMSAVSVDFKAIDKRKNAVINGLGFGLEAMLWKKNRGIDVVKGRATLLDAHTIEVDNGKVKKTVTAENIVVAVGSEPCGDCGVQRGPQEGHNFERDNGLLAPAAEEHRDHRLRRHRA